MVKLRDPTIYTPTEQKLILEKNTCPECRGELHREGDKLVCEDCEDCGFFCSVEEV